MNSLETLSPNQKAGGTQALGEEKKPVVQQADIPAPDPSSKRKKDTGGIKLPPAIDKRADVDKIIEHIDNTVRQSINARNTWQQNLQAWHDQYKGVVPEKTFPWDGCSNLHIPITGILVDTLLSRMMNPLFSIAPLVTARGVSAAGATPDLPPNEVGTGQGPVITETQPRTISDHELAKDVENMMHFVLNKRVGAYLKIQSWIKESLIYGRGIMKIIWRKSKRKYTRQMNERDVLNDVQSAQVMVQTGRASQEVLQFLNEMLHVLENHDFQKTPIIKVEREEVTYDNPDWVFIPIEDFGFHPKAIDITSSPYVFHRFREDIDTILKKEDDGIYANAHLLAGGTGFIGGVESSDGDIRLDDVQTLSEGYDTSTLDDEDNQKEIELIEWHGKFDIDGDGRTEDVIATFAIKEKVLLSVRESDLLHGKKPFAEIKLFPMPGRFESQGIPEQIADLQTELNDIHNMRIDNGTLTNAVMFWYDPASDIDPEIHKPGPGMGFPAGNNQFGVVQTGDVKFSSFREEELVRRLIQDRIGITDFAIGNDVTAAANQTATGTNALVNEGNQRLEMMLKNVNIGLNEAVLQTFQLIQQFGSEEIMFRMVEDFKAPVKTISARDIAGQWDVELAANSVNTNRILQIQELQQMLQIVGQAGPENTNMAPLLREVLQKMGSKIVDEIVKPEEEAFFNKVAQNPEMLMAVKQQIDMIAEQSGLIPPQQEQGVGGTTPAAPAPMPPQGGIDLQGIMQQLGPMLQGLFSGGGGQQPPAVQPPMPPPPSKISMQ